MFSVDLAPGVRVELNNNNRLSFHFDGRSEIVQEGSLSYQLRPAMAEWLTGVYRETPERFVKLVGSFGANVSMMGSAQLFLLDRVRDIPAIAETELTSWNLSFLDLMRGLVQQMKDNDQSTDGQSEADKLRRLLDDQ